MRGTFDMRKIVIAPLAALLTISAAQGAGQAPDLAAHTALAVAPNAVPGTLSVLTYNVHGMPWPVAAERSSDLAAIGARLQRMRLAGTAQQVVLLQETFTADAQAIAARAGYRYAVVGPDHAADAGRASDDAAGQTAQWWHGEGVGTLLDSGLMILSDYPITAVRRMAFTANDCAGFDCLASKGVLLAAITLPGGQIIEVATAHLNSRHASGVSAARADSAWARQWESMRGFVAARRNPAVPLIIAGDFNVGRNAGRRAVLRHALASQPNDAAFTSALTTLARARAGWSTDLDRAIQRGKDWTLSIPGQSRRALPISAAATFGAGPDGAMLSDHVGYTVTYRFQRSAHQL
jgi:endonuclease/exonuclease/phosphatase family metal-dependent hydrolase